MQTDVSMKFKITLDQVETMEVPWDVTDVEEQAESLFDNEEQKKTND